MNIYFDNLIFFLFLDDITMTADGVDTYQIVKDAKRYQYVKFDLKLNINSMLITILTFFL